MRCLRMQATIPVSTCLLKQAELARYVSTRKMTWNYKTIDVPNNPAQPCYKCPQGAEIKKNGGSDMDVKEIIEQTTKEIKKDTGFVPTVMRTCSKCGIEKGVSQFQGSRVVCRKCSITATRARMKEANKSIRQADKDSWQSGPRIPDPSRRSCGPESSPTFSKLSLSVEIGGQRIELCNSCALRYLKIGG